MKRKNNIFYDKTLSKRHKSAKRFKFYAIFSLVLSISFLVFFLCDMFVKGLPALKQTYIKVDITYTSKCMKSYRACIDKKLRKVISRSEIRSIPLKIENNPKLLNTTVSKWLLANHQVDQYIKGHYYKLKSKDKRIVDTLNKENRVELNFNRVFFTKGDSKIPEFAGIKSAIIGTIFTLLVTMLVAFPIGVMTAIYLEEFAPNNKFTQLI